MQVASRQVRAWRGFFPTFGPETGLCHREHSGRDRGEAAPNWNWSLANPPSFVVSGWHLAIRICSGELIVVLLCVQVGLACSFILFLRTRSAFERRQGKLPARPWLWEVASLQQLAWILMNMHDKYHTLTYLIECLSGNCLFPLYSHSVTNFWSLLKNTVVINSHKISFFI